MYHDHISCYNKTLPFFLSQMIPVFPFTLSLNCGSEHLSLLHVSLACLYVPLPLNTSLPRTPR